MKPRCTPTAFTLSKAPTIVAETFVSLSAVVVMTEESFEFMKIPIKKDTARKNIITITIK
jgi:hypothetical protein